MNHDYFDDVILVTDDFEDMTEVDVWAVTETRQDLVSAIEGASPKALRLILEGV